jgi:hypothetical protein
LNETDQLKAKKDKKVFDSQLFPKTDIHSKKRFKTVNMQILPLTILVFFGTLQNFESFHVKEFSKFNFSAKTSNLSNAVLKVLEVLKATQGTPNLISLGTSKEFGLRDFTNELVLNYFNLTKWKIRQEIAGKNTKPHRKGFSIFILENFLNFLKIYNEITRDGYKFNGNFLIVFIGGEIQEIQEVFKLSWKLQIYNVNVMFEKENGEVSMKTFMPFSDGNCSDTTPVLINKFKNGKFVNGNENFFPKKMKNLYNCSVRVAIANNSEPGIIVKKKLDGRFLKNPSLFNFNLYQFRYEFFVFSLSIGGRNIRILNALSKDMNFRINYTFIGNIGFLLDNGTTNGPYKALIDRTADVSASGMWLKPNRMKLFDYTTSYINDQLIFIVPPGRDLTAIQRLVYPFENLLWISVFATFTIGILVIFVIKQKTRKVQDFVFGSGVNNPYLNIFIAFIGGSQNILPQRNFARFLLMMFLMYSLVIRTLYQASFYEILKSNKKYGEVQTIDEMIEKDFRFYVYFDSVDLLHGKEEVRKRFVLQVFFKINTKKTFDRF